MINRYDVVKIALFHAIGCLRVDAGSAAKQKRQWGQHREKKKNARAENIKSNNVDESTTLIVQQLDLMTWCFVCIYRALKTLMSFAKIRRENHTNTWALACVNEKSNIYFSYHYYHQKVFLFYFYRNEVYSYDCRSDLRCIWLVFSKNSKLTDNVIYFIIRKIDFRCCLTDANSGICDLQICGGFGVDRIRWKLSDKKALELKRTTESVGRLILA